MGQTHAREEIFQELDDIAEETNFSTEEIHGLYTRYTEIANSTFQDQSIHKEEFRKALGMNSSFMADRLFDLFDKDKSGQLDFRELCLGLSHFSPDAATTDKIEFTFRVYDLKCDGFITPDELTTVVSRFLEDEGIYHTNSHVSEIVRQTFREADTNRDGKICLEEYSNYTLKHPEILANLTLRTWEIPIDDEEAE